MMIRRQFVPAGIADGEYEISSDATGTAMYRLVPVEQADLMTSAGMDARDYVHVQVKSRIGWVSVKSEDRAQRTFERILAERAA